MKHATLTQPASQPITVADWHTAPRAAALLATMAGLHHAALAMPERIGADLNSHRSQIGFLVNREVSRGLGMAWAMEVQPAHGCCTVAELWDEVRAERGNAIKAQVLAEGLDPDSDEGFERAWALQDEAPTVQAVAAQAVAALVKGEVA